MSLRLLPCNKTKSAWKGNGRRKDRGLRGEMEMELFVMLCAVVIEVVLGTAAIADAVQEDQPER